MMEKVGVTLLLCILFASAISAPNVTATYITYSSTKRGCSLERETDEFHTSSIDAHEKRDVDALLSFKNAITSDPYGALSNWTAHNAENVCSWTGILCNRRVVAIDLGQFDLKGTLSPSLGNLSFLKCLDMSYNMLNGSIPEAIANLNQLWFLDLHSNRLSGHIPHSIGQLKSLTWLDLSNNNISGTIPDSIGSLISLHHLDIRKNNLHGLIPQGISNSMLRVLDVSHNSFSGDLHIEFPNSLQYLDVSHNLFSGDLHISFPIFLESLIVSHNSFSGNLHIDFPLNLEHFSASSNHFYGTFPSSLTNCTQLRLLDLSENNLTRELPTQHPNFYELKVLSIAYNHFHGGIPQWITNLTNLQVLDLSNNKFNGRIPSNLQHLTGFKVNISSSIPYDGTLYYELRIDMKGARYDLSYVLMTNAILDLSSNDLMGEIPTSMGSLSSLRLLNLSGNQLDREIPASLSNISTLEQLDLAKNNLSGCIPQELSQLFWLAYLNVSSNNLCGPIPTGRQFSTFTETSFQRNKCLCGYISQPCNHQNRSSPADDNTKSNVKEGWLRHVEENVSLIALELGMGIGFGGVVAMFIVWDRARNWVVPPHRRPFFGMYRFPK